MTQFLQFLTNHWMLAATFAILVVAYAINEWWTQKTGPGRLSTQALVEQLNHNQAKLIDLRTLSDFNRGHIIHAMHIEHDKLADNINQLTAYKDKPVILVCGLGQKSLAAGRFLHKQGFLHVFYLVGGMSAWHSDNLPLEKGREE